jgi:Mg/Co/Ni transporter MgtE
MNSFLVNMAESEAKNEVTNRVDVIPESQKQRLIELVGKERAEKLIESTRYAIQKQIEELTLKPEKRKKYKPMIQYKLEEIIRMYGRNYLKFKKRPTICAMMERIDEWKRAKEFYEYLKILVKTERKVTGYPLV